MHLMMESFQFSATSLQDYVDCPRRFLLSHLLQIPWPVPETPSIDEAEHRMQVGQELHRLIYQHLLGLPEQLLFDTVTDPLVFQWWKSYLEYVTPLLQNRRVFAEVGFSTPLIGHRLSARFDAITIADTSSSSGRTYTIMDWKTYRHRPSRHWLANRLQTRVYPCVLVLAGAMLNEGRPITPDEIEMQYWLAEYPQNSEIFRYDRASYEADVVYLSDLIADITSRIPSEKWPLTGDPLRQCKFCCYRTLCGRDDESLYAGVEIPSYQAPDRDLAKQETEIVTGMGQIQESEY